METYLYCFPLWLLISNCFSFTTSKSLFNLTTDEYALVAFKNSIISSPNSIMFKNWSMHKPICQWTGVSCGAKHRRVTALNVSGFDLQGTMAPHLGNLTFLRYLDISSNNLRGVLPVELSKLRQLEYINVGANNFTGEIPSWFGALSQVRQMYLSNNSFSGRIPTCLFNNISRLEILYMEYNILDGSIPKEIGTSPSLERVSFEGNELSGSIPDSIFNISSLIAINFGNNSLTGKLPNNMCSNTPKLRELTVYWNQLHGEIPRNVDQCRELVVLSLQVNNFNGNIPSEIGSLGMLEALYLWSNRFKGSIPKQIGNLTSLMLLNLESNYLTGELPEELSKLAFLGMLGVYNNSLSGAIPPAVFNISTLQFIGLSSNQFSGTLPSDMGLHLFSLEELYLDDNRFSGPIPNSINNATQLVFLNFQFNSFSGSIPSFASLRLLTRIYLGVNNLTGSKSATQELEFLSSLTNSYYLQVIQVSRNPLGGLLPTSIGNLSQSLEIFASMGTGIRGGIPCEIGNLTSLMDLNLYDNLLSGSIPSTIGNLKKLGRLALSKNQLGGPIPIDLCQMTSLAELDFENNELQGRIPDCLGKLQSLREIRLGSNKLNSTIPSDFWNLKDLIILSFYSNYLSGQIPSQIGQMKVVNQIDLSFNLFSGEIPSSIEGCESLEYLYLSDNKFGGSIPQSLGNMRGLSGLDLSNNTLSGLIPKSLQDLKLLEYLNVSFNGLEGEIPNGGAFANFTAQSFFHNSALCGASRFEVPPCLDVDARSRSKNVNARLIKYILTPLVSTLVLVIIAVILIRRRKHNKGQISVDTASLGVSWRITSYIELLRATDSFREANLLGRGSYGSVFKGTFADGLHFAAKVFNLELERANKSFGTESRILSTIRHRNLVRVIGCCTNMEFKALILEFMPNGSLDSWLYSSSSDSTDILQLLNIAIDVALALEYLHHGNAFPVVHCDMKPSNVLLDEDMTARVADFGISKLFEEGEAMIQTKTLATAGYAAPEYGSEGKVSTSADVYSFGIMLVEMFTRKKPTDDMFDEQMSLKEWVSDALQVNAMNEILAPALLSAEDRHFVPKEKCVASAFDLAMKCLAVSPEERINMIEATRVLKKIKEKFEFEVTPRRQRHAITVT